MILSAPDRQTILDLDRALEVLLHNALGRFLMIIFLWQLIIITLSHFVRIRKGVGVGFFLRVRAEHVVHVVLKLLDRVYMVFMVDHTEVLVVRLSIAFPLKKIVVLHGSIVFAKALFFTDLRSQLWARATAVEGRKSDFFELVFLLFDGEELPNAIAGHTVLSSLLIVRDVRLLVRHLAFRSLSQAFLICLEIFLHFQRS